MPINLTNKNLHIAKTNKKDEFYTQLSDIEDELKNYKKYFKDRVVLCNCDDPKISNFYRYFLSNFDTLGLKKLIVSCYKNQEVALFENKQSEPAIWLEYDGSKSSTHQFEGDGDFRSKEVIQLLEKTDIVVTNPPFSLFREYVSQLIGYDKKFLIIGHQNAITCKEIFRLFMENKLWLGYGFKGFAGYFINTLYEDYATATSRKEGTIRVAGVHWFTNLMIEKRHEDLILNSQYNLKTYPKYDNYDAIEVSKTKEIPVDYGGVMGVPITFLNKYSPKQFEILGKTNNKEHAGQYLIGENPNAMLNGKKLYHRILIKNKQLKN